MQPLKRMGRLFMTWKDLKDVLNEKGRYRTRALKILDGDSSYY